MSDVKGGIRKVELGMVELTMELQIDAPPQRVYDAYVNETGRWWSRSYVMGGPRTTDILIEPVPGGKLLEVFDNGGGNVWGIVMGIDPGRSIRIGLPDGVLWSGAGMFEVRFEPQGEGTLVKVSHSCIQQYGEGGEAGYRQGWEELISDRFKRYAEGGVVEDAVRAQ